jgi:hypothetical protein
MSSHDYEIELIRNEGAEDSPVTGALLKGLPEELFGEETAELWIEETEESKFRADSDHGMKEFSTVVDAVLASAGEYWKGHPVPRYGDGDTFLLIDHDGRKLREFVARKGMIIRKERDWIDQDEDL